jgi:beta-lactam-binding protein with PASTA domain/tRNA A-37 threonylcarbamoyl transferase component Bud32
LAEIGNVLGGRYRLVELLGQGGMATIYRARDNELERDVAVKLLRPEYERDPDFGTRFRQEARAAGSLNHPNIVSVYDYGNDQAGAYIVMELIDGEDLASVIRRTGAVPPRQAARLAADVASALAAAHGRGIIHRDVKPANVLVSRDGRVKVTDFGIARAVADAQLTMPGLTMGSVHYFSPEQARGEPTTAASDVYSLGIVLYELLTGRRPWGGDSAAAIAMARLSGAAPLPSAVRAGIPPALDAIVRRAMSRDPAQRYQSAGEMREALDAFLADRAPSAAPSPVGVGAAAAAAGAAGGLAAGGLTASRGMDPVDPISPATVASGVARPNAGRVPYDQDAYAGSYAPARERYTEPPPPRRRVADDEYDEEPRGTSPWVWISALLALAILAVVGFLVFRLLSGPGKPAVEQVTVPTLVGKPFDQAKVLAEGVGLTAQITAIDSTSTQPANTVLVQDPKAGASVAKGGKVNLTIAGGPQQVQVPSLINHTEDDALNLLAQAGLKAGKRVDAFDPTIPAGNVIDQNPSAGQPVTAGSAVAYTVSKGPEPTPTPSPTPKPTPTPTPAPINVGDYRCMTLGEAGSAIEADQFRVGNVVVDAETKAANPGYAPEESSIVVAQAPGPGTKRRPGSRIDLTVHDPAIPLATCPPP